MGGFSLSDFLNLFAMMIVLGGLTIVITSPQTAAILTAFGNTFSQSLRTAMGR